MPAGVGLFIDPEHTEPVDSIALSDADISEGIGTGESHQLYGLNTGTTALRDLRISLDGDGSDHVQLSHDGEVWAHPGDGIVLPGVVLSGDEFGFWARGTFNLEDMEGRYPFKFKVSAKSLGLG